MKRMQWDKLTSAEVALLASRYDAEVASVDAEIRLLLVALNDAEQRLSVRVSTAPGFAPLDDAARENLCAPSGTIRRSCTDGRAAVLHADSGRAARAPRAAAVPQRCAVHRTVEGGRRPRLLPIEEGCRTAAC